jgi:capsular polysaccharide biosynthesis protein
MELKEVIKIFWKYRITFVTVVFLVVAFASVWKWALPKNYAASLMLNVTRSGTQQTSEYAYDDFYRLQADERFADTVVRWLGDPSIINDIYSSAKVSLHPSESLKGKRLSSQMISVTFVSPTIEDAKKTANSIIGTLNKQTEKLNEQQKQQTWFLIQGSSPVITVAGWPWLKILAASLFAGIFLAFWIVLGRHYFER